MTRAQSKEACLVRRIVEEGVDGEDDLGDDQVRVGAAGLGARCGGGSGSGLLPGMGDDGGALHEPHGTAGPRRLQVPRHPGHCRRVGGVPASGLVHPGARCARSGGWSAYWGPELGSRRGGRDTLSEDFG
jgi:hypothetical protein